MSSRRSFTLALTVGITIFFARTTAYFTECNDAYCFTIPDQHGGTNFTLAFAQTTCRNNGSRLAEVNSSEAQIYTTIFLNMAVSNNRINRTIIILNAQQHENISWNWVNGKTSGNITVRSQDDVYAKFGYLGRENSYIYVGASVPTVTKSAYMCEVPAVVQNSTSSRGCSFLHSGRCYITVYQEETWFSARNKCLEMGGDLASFDNITNNAALMTLDAVVDRPPSTFWVGIRKTSWIWRDSNTDVKYTNWQTGHPKNYSLECLCLTPDNSQWYWIECDCDAIYYYQYFCISDWKPEVDDSSSNFIRKYDNQTFALINQGVVAPQKSFFEAQKLCKAFDSQGYLVEIPNLNVQAHLVKFLDEARANQLLSSMHVIVNAQNIEPNTWNWADGKNVIGITVGGQTGMPIAMLRGYLQTSDIMVYVDQPTRKRPYICEFPENPSCCQKGFCYDGKCYKSYTDTYTWYEARNDCLEKNDGDLASFENITSDDGLKKLNGTWLLSGTTYWINLKYNNWKWNNTGSYVKYTNWSDGQSTDFSKSCICLNGEDGWKWSQCSCSGKYNFVCKTERQPNDLANSLANGSPDSRFSISASMIAFTILWKMCLWVSHVR